MIIPSSKLNNYFIKITIVIFLIIAGIIGINNNVVATQVDIPVSAVTVDGAKVTGLIRVFEQWYMWDFPTAMIEGFISFANRQATKIINTINKLSSLDINNIANHISSKRVPGIFKYDTTQNIIKSNNTLIIHQVDSGYGIGVTAILSIPSVPTSTKSKTYLDIGLRYYDGVNIVRLAIDPTLTSPLRIAKNGKIYSIALVDVNNPKASSLRIMTPLGVKALRKL